MILDKELCLADAQAVTSVGNNPSTNVLDLKAAGDLDNLFLYTRVDTTATSGTSTATVTIELQTDDNEAFSSPKTLIKTGALGVASLIAGYEPLKTRIPLGVERFLRVIWTVAVEALTAGKFDAFLTFDVESR